MTSGVTGVTGDAVVVLITAALLTGMLIVNTLVMGSGCDLGSGSTLVSVFVLADSARAFLNSAMELLMIFRSAGYSRYSGPR